MLTKIGLFFVLTVTSIILSFYFLDKPIALFVAQHNLPDYPFFFWISKIANVILGVATLNLIYLSIKAVLRPISRLQKQLFTASLAIIVTALLELYLELFSIGIG